MRVFNNKLFLLNISGVDEESINFINTTNSFLQSGHQLYLKPVLKRQLSKVKLPNAEVEIRSRCQWHLLD